MKERPILFSGPMVRAILDGTKTQTRRVTKPQPKGEYVARFSAGGFHDDDGDYVSPYGVPGDRLWVRETWREGDYGSIFYRADEEWDKEIGWKPSIFMPRTHSRLSLEVTGVRVERVQEITEDDAYAEGCFALGDCECTAQRQYQILWDTLNAKRGFGWDKNPWAWVIEFRMVT